MDQDNKKQPKKPQTELDHDELRYQHAKHFDDHTKGTHNCGHDENLKSLINPGSTKGNPNAPNDGPNDDREVPFKNEADQGMEKK